jgi:hypothetical protein
MRSLQIGSVSALLALSWLPAPALAHEGHVHTILGTIERVEKARLDVKDTGGATVTFVVTAKTVFQRGEKAIQPSELKVGDRVAVESEQSASAMTALKVRLGTTEAKTVYTCPMHPEVVSDKPGKCSKCGMNLVPKAKKP